MKESKKEFESRKKDHIKWSLNPATQKKIESDFSKIKLIHRPLPDLKFSEVDITTTLFGVDRCSPFFISSMTAGHAQSKKINSQLMAAAEKKKWIFAVGSQKKELFDSKAADEWKKLRAKHKDVIVLSNIGIEQVISMPVDRIIGLQRNLQSSGIIVHLNSIQELFQNRFSAEFSLKNGLRAIENLVNKSKVPVIVKEVGFGFDIKTIQRLSEIGVAIIDLAGNGGTHWGYVEALRSQGGVKSTVNKLKMISAFDEWGYSNIEMLKNIQNLKERKHDVLKKTQIWSSGGIRSGVDAVKCLCLGAKAVGVAQPLMKACLMSTSKKQSSLLTVMDEFELELKVALFAMGISDLNKLTKEKNWYEK
jgi:isopentenyl-diphosphate Delta-isomerase